MIRFYLVRHGQSVSNRDKIFSGQNDVPLSEVGKRQAQLVARRLQAEKIDAAYASSLSRAMETAAPIAAIKGLSVTPQPDFREVYFGWWEGTSIEELTATDPNYLLWKQYNAKYHPIDGEPQREAGPRFLRAITEVARRSKDGDGVLIVAHGCVLLSFLCEIGYYDYDTATYDCIPRNASLTQVGYENGTFTVLSFGETDYLGSEITSTNLV